MRLRNLLAALSIFAVPCLAQACVIKIGKGDGSSDTTDDTAGGGGDGDTGGTGGDDTGSGPTPEEIQMGYEAYSQLDPAELQTASVLAGNSTCALVATIENLGLDPTTLDDAALIDLMEQYLPAAEQQAQEWLSGEDWAMLAYSLQPKYECVDYGCQYHGKCNYGYQPGVKYVCFIDDCGPSKCQSCPSWINDLLKALIIKAWCSYVCVESGTSPPHVVAVGAGGVSAFKGNFVGLFCQPYP